MILPSIILPKFSSLLRSMRSFAVNNYSLPSVRLKMILSILFAGSSAFAAYDLSRYEAIIDRAPFGKEPPSETAEPARPDGEFARQYRLCMLYKNSDGQLKAGLVSKTNNKNFFLQVGESGEGLSLVDIRLEDGVAVLQQGDETAQLILEGLGTPWGPISPASATASSAPATALQQVRRVGADQIPEHIRLSLVDSSPKQPRIAISRSSGGGAENPAETRNEISTRPATVKKPYSGNYLVQSVPQRYNPF
jgi:hypothetical protein